ncbi:unnamed protein product, partial [Rotaria sp. Silwood1]
RSRSHSNYRPTPLPIKPRRVHQQQHQQKFNRPHYHQQHHRNYHQAQQFHPNHQQHFPRSSNIPSPNIPPTYHHLVQQIPRKPSLYGAGQRKFNHFKRFQT